MNLSGILVVVPHGRVDETVSRLNALPGVEVHHIDAPSGRIVVVQEGETIDDEVQGLKRIKKLPDVILAEMVYHYFADDTQLLTDIPDKLGALEDFQTAEVPASLYTPGE
jgi:nitrate reductase NapD